MWDQIELLDLVNPVPSPLPHNIELGWDSLLPLSRLVSSLFLLGIEYSIVGGLSCSFKPGSWLMDCLIDWEESPLLHILSVLMALLG